MQQLRKYATVLELLLGSGPRATREVLLEAVFYFWSAPSLYYPTDRVQVVSAVQCNGASAVEGSELIGWVT
jgi:hypothetical protein